MSHRATFKDRLFVCDCGLSFDAYWLYTTHVDLEGERDRMNRYRTPDMIEAKRKVHKKRSRHTACRFCQGRFKVGQLVWIVGRNYYCSGRCAMLHKRT